MKKIKIAEILSGFLKINNKGINKNIIQGQPMEFIIALKTIPESKAVQTL